MIKFTKIISTIGPASNTIDTIKQLINNGTNIFRLNFSHGTIENHEAALMNIRRAAKELNTHIAVFQDLQGPKIRVGELENNAVELIKDRKLIITPKPIVGNQQQISIDYHELHHFAKPGYRILLDDGNLELTITAVDGDKIITKIINGGTLKPHKGVNLPDFTLTNLPSLTDKDIADLQFAFDHNLDYVALSFVRTRDDVLYLKDLMQQKYGRLIPIIAKIETPKALTNIDDIIDETDIIMVARGDLGVETSYDELPLIQKMIIKKCNLNGTPVITATQMLESMIKSARPTRAEVNDVANSIIDGADAVMLSGETAVGTYPVKASNAMQQVALKTERSLPFKDSININNETERSNSLLENAIAYSAVKMIDKIDAQYIVCVTQSGRTAQLLSKYRPSVPIIAFSPNDKTLRLLAVNWGVTSHKINRMPELDQLFDFAKEYMMENNYAKHNDNIVVVCGVPLCEKGNTNMLKVVQI